MMGGTNLTIKRPAVSCARRWLKLRVGPVSTLTDDKICSILSSSVVRRYCTAPDCLIGVQLPAVASVRSVATTAGPHTSRGHTQTRERRPEAVTTLQTAATAGSWTPIRQSGAVQ